MTTWDAIVIGAGPGGSALANLLARAGHQVALLEKQTFPRFQIGESLVPAVNTTLAKLGVLDEMDRRGFPRKHGVQFFSPTGPTRPFYFSEVADPRMHHTWQVLRSSFDAMLFEHAGQAGADARTDTEVTGLLATDGTVTGVRVRHPDGTEDTMHARVVADATGQNGLVTRKLGGRQVIAGLENSAVFAHYEGAVLDGGIDAGSTLIFRLDDLSWLWFIPLPEAVSVGLVTPARQVGEFGSSPEEILDNAIRRSEPLAERLRAARRTTPVRAMRDFSYRTEHDGGPGWLLVGDALGFIDPIYSTGLFLTMLSADLGATAIDGALRDGGTPPDFTGYATEYRAAYEQLLTLVQAFYTEEFHFGELARVPEHRQGLVDLLTGVVGTPQANEVTRAIRAFFDQRMMI